MAMLFATAETLLAAQTVFHPGGLAVARSLALGLLAGAGVLWGAIDTWYRRTDRGLVWLKAALLAGVLAGILSVIGRAAFVDQTGVAALWPAITGQAAFRALVVLVPAWLGLQAGKLLGSRAAAGRPPGPPHSHPHRRPRGHPRSRAQPGNADRSAPTA